MRRVLASLGFACGSALQNFRRNLGLSVTGVITIGFILAAMGAAVVVTHILGTILAQQQGNASRIQIYLQDSLSEQSIANYQDHLAHDPRVTGVTFSNKDDALKTAEARGTIEASQISALGGLNPLPAELNVKVGKLSDLPELNSEASASPLADTNTNYRTDYNASVTSTLQSINFWVMTIAIVGCLIFAFISLVIVMNTIRTAVFARRVEIEIMKLVGATDWFVRWPFILEGIIGGLLAAAFSGAIVYGGYRVVAHLLSVSNIAPVGYDAGFALFLVALIALAGAALGAAGSYLGVRRFLTV